MEVREGGVSFLDRGGADFGDSPTGDTGVSKTPIECLCKGDGLSFERFRTDLRGVEPFSGDKNPASVTGGDEGDFKISWKSLIPVKEVSESEFLLELHELEWIEEQPLLTCSSIERIKFLTDNV